MATPENAASFRNNIIARISDAFDPNQSFDLAQAKPLSAIDPPSPQNSGWSDNL
jgi:hypothetical protein